MYWILGVLLLCVLFKVYREYRRVPGFALLIYVIIIVMDLAVGGSIIVWKCAISKSEEECELATSGTVGSVVIWLLVMIVCPCFATRCEICVTWDNLRKKCAQYMDKIRHKKRHADYIQNKVYLPATLTLLGKGHCLPVTNGSVVHPCENTTQLTPLSTENGSARHEHSKVYIFHEKEGPMNQGLVNQKTMIQGPLSNIAHEDV